LSKSIVDCQLPIADFEEARGGGKKIGNWQSEIGNKLNL
jgi:hypothetical protein